MHCHNTSMINYHNAHIHHNSAPAQHYVNVLAVMKLPRGLFGLKVLLECYWSDISVFSDTPIKEQIALYAVIYFSYVWLFVYHNDKHKGINSTFHINSSLLYTDCHINWTCHVIIVMCQQHVRCLGAKIITLYFSFTSLETQNFHIIYSRRFSM